MAQHFNLKTHNYINDLKFLIFKDNLELSERLSIENDLINLFLKLRLNILNKIIPIHFLPKNLVFVIKNFKFFLNIFSLIIKLFLF